MWNRMIWRLRDVDLEKWEMLQVELKDIGIMKCKIREQGNLIDETCKQGMSKK